MQDNYIDLVRTEIKIDGRPVEDNFALELAQTMSGHHRFEVRVNYNALRESVWVETPESIFQSLYKPLSITFVHRFSGEKSVFRGIITEIDIEGEYGDKGAVIFRGGSPTLLLDMNPTMKSFENEYLSTLVGKLTDDFKNDISVAVNTKHNFAMDYLAQYDETVWNFLSRIASSCGEWFYYDGTKLIVGDPDIQKESIVVYNRELKKVKFTSRLLNLNREIYDYRYSTDSYISEFAEWKLSGRGFNSYSRIARDKSEKLFPHLTIQKSPREIMNGIDSGFQMKAINSRGIQQMSVMTAESDTCAIRLGELIITTLPKEIVTKGGSDLGRYRVIEMRHTVDGNGVYRNRITGVPGMTEVPPADPAIFVPMAAPEPAIVVDNDDPQKLGRVKVKTYWMDTRRLDTTNWIRVSSPGAGMSESVKRNRGFVWIPEKGDQVMISYENFDSGRPYVSGSLFHKNNAGGAAVNNAIKSISTRSGHLIEFNDDEKGGWGITIKDRNGNTIRLDTKGKNIEITAPETITMNAKNISINAEESIAGHAGQDITMQADSNIENSAGENCRLSANNLYTQASEGSMHTAKKYDVLGEKTRIDSTNENLELASAKEVDVQSAKKVKLF